MINRAILVGRVGQFPEQVKFENGGSVVKFPVATNRNYKKDGEWQQVTTWHNIDVKYDKIQDRALKLNKGDLVAVEGEIENRTYERDGKKMVFSSVVAQMIRTIERNETAKPSPKQTPEESGRPDTENDDLPF